MNPNATTVADLWSRLRDAHDAISPLMSLDELLAAVLHGARVLSTAADGTLWVRRFQVVPHESGGATLFDPRSGEMRRFSAQPLSSGEEAWVVLQQKAGALAQAKTAGAVPLSALAQSVVGTKQARENATFYALPLMVGNDVLGVLELRGEPLSTQENATALQNPMLRALLGYFVTQSAKMLMAAQLFRQLEDAKLQWEIIFDGLEDGVCIERADGVILRANKAMADLLGVAISQMVRRTRQELYAQLPGFRLLPEQQTENPARSREFSFGDPAHIVSQRIFDLHLPEWSKQFLESALDGESETPRVCVLSDITERRRLQEHLLQSEKLAALGELVSGVAHELNNPLATVVGYVQLLADNPNLGESTRNQIEIIHAEATRASRIVGNLLRFARRESTQRLPLDINDCLREVVEMRAYQLRAHNVQLHTEYAPSLPPLCGDAHQLQQVFLNILNNAQQATTKWRGSGNIHVKTENSTLHGAPAIQISFIDDGPGIAPQHLRRIFDPFFTTKPVNEGTGLGMSLSMGIIAEHKGEISVNSTVGYGAQFFILLPAAEMRDGRIHCGEASASAIFESAQRAFEAPPPDEDSPSNQEGTAPMSATLNAAPATDFLSGAPKAAGSAEILVIDDEETVVTLLSEILVGDGYRVTPASDGAEALSLLHRKKFDLIVSDVRMPTLSGATFYDILQVTRPEMASRIIFVTGDIMSVSTQEFLREAGQPVLTKPFEPQRLRDLAQQVLSVAR